MKEKADHVVSITDKEQLRVISVLNKEIAERKVLIEKLMPKFEDKELQLHLAQKEFDDVNKEIQSIKDDIESDIRIIRAIRHFKDSDADKQLRVVGVEKKPSVSGFKSPKQVNWLIEASNVLLKVNRFITFEELWYLMGENPELVEAVNKTNRGWKGSKRLIENNLTIHATRTFTTNRKQQFIIYNDKFGLPEWVDAKGVMLPKFLFK
jgi:hypothetical protein